LSFRFLQKLFSELLEQVERLAPHFFPILVYGEHGTGKSSLAFYIHKKSTCTQFERIDCEALVEKECDQALKKAFAKNESSTIYIKHIEHLSDKNQKLLLALMENKKHHRIIASSKKSLFTCVQKNTFNETLFYQLNRAPFELPPLRKRPYDIPLLIDYYLEIYNTKYKKKIVLTTQSIRQLRNFTWPGNILELQQVVQKIVSWTTQEYHVITPSNLVTILGEREVQFIEEQSLARFDSLDQATTEFKRNFLLYLLQKNHYNITQVSQRLNLSPVQLKNTLLELKINI